MSKIRDKCCHKVTQFTLLTIESTIDATRLSMLFVKDTNKTSDWFRIEFLDRNSLVL